MKTIKTILGGIVVCAWSGLLAWAAPPYINSQGLLNGANGQPLPTGTYKM